MMGATPTAVFKPHTKKKENEMDNEDLRNEELEKTAALVFGAVVEGTSGFIKHFGGRCNDKVLAAKLAFYMCRMVCDCLCDALEVKVPRLAIGVLMNSGEEKEIDIFADDWQAQIDAL